MEIISVLNFLCSVNFVLISSTLALIQTNPHRCISGVWSPRKAPRQRHPNQPWRTSPDNRHSKAGNNGQTKWTMVSNWQDKADSDKKPEPSMLPQQIHHRALQTTLTGTSHTTNEGTTVHSYRGIPYARIPARFERSELIERFDEDTFDATRYGYIPLSLTQTGLTEKWKTPMSTSKYRRAPFTADSRAIWNCTRGRGWVCVFEFGDYLSSVGWEGGVSSDFGLDSW